MLKTSRTMRHCHCAALQAFKTFVTTLALCATSVAQSNSVNTAAVKKDQALDFKLVILNGGMTQGHDIPAEWNGKFGDVQVARDTAVFKEAPASLRVTASAGKSGQAFQKFNGGKGAKLKIAGWLKTSGNVKVQAAVHAFAEGFKNNQFIQLKFVQGESDWQSFEKEVQLPDWTAFFNILLQVEGDGSAWLDEVREAGSAVDAGKPQSMEERMTSGAPPKDKPSVPGWGFYPQFPTAWQSTFKSQLERTKKGGVNVVFLGDSITQGWGDPKGGKQVWEKTFEPLGAVNYGIGGDSTRQVLWRLEHGLVEGLQPKLVVLKIGTNNLYDDHNGGSDEEIAKGIETVVKTVQAKLPQTNVLLLGVLPRQNAFFSSRIQRINAIIQNLGDGTRVHFMDLGLRFQKTPGQGDVNKELFTGDLLHLSSKGYEVMAEELRPMVEKLAR